MPVTTSEPVWVDNKYYWFGSWGYSVETDLLAPLDSPSLLSSLEPLKSFVPGVKILAEVSLGQTLAGLYSHLHTGIYNVFISFYVYSDSLFTIICTMYF